MEISAALPLVPQPTLLIVDDQKSVLTTLEFLFAQRGYHVCTAESGAAAIALFGQQAFDAAIIDLHMPAMDGTQVCRRLIAHAAETHHPVVVWLMTAVHTADAARLALDAGAVGLLKKPFDWLELCRAIEARAQSGDVPHQPPLPPIVEQAG